MKVKSFLVVLIAAAFVLGIAGTVFPEHYHQSMGTVKGTVTETKVTEVEVTIKDDKGKEIQIRTKDTGAFKLGDRVVIQDGKISKEVKPITGGY
jgi:outer membrane lipoprotein SlyB